jgi:hypothetical protein
MQACCMLAESPYTRCACHTAGYNVPKAGCDSSHGDCQLMTWAAPQGAADCSSLVQPIYPSLLISNNDSCRMCCLAVLPCSMKDRIGPGTCGQGTTGPSLNVLVFCAGNETMVSFMRDQIHAGTPNALGRGEARC